MDPIHTHDCDDCEFLGTVDGIDHYHCDDEAISGDRGGSLIARRSSDGPHYSSMPVWLVKKLPSLTGPLGETYRLWKERQRQ